MSSFKKIPIFGQNSNCGPYKISFEWYDSEFSLPLYFFYFWLMKTWRTNKLMKSNLTEELIYHVEFFTRCAFITVNIFSVQASEDFRKIIAPRRAVETRWKKVEKYFRIGNRLEHWNYINSLPLVLNDYLLDNHYNMMIIYQFN